jgi:hypothetical protein
MMERLFFRIATMLARFFGSQMKSQGFRMASTE